MSKMAFIGLAVQNAAAKGDGMLDMHYLMLSFIILREEPGVNSRCIITCIPLRKLLLAPRCCHDATAPLGRGMIGKCGEMIFSSRMHIFLICSGFEAFHIN